MSMWALIASAVVLGCPVAVCAVVAALVLSVDRDRRPEVIKDLTPVLIALVTGRRLRPARGGRAGRLVSVRPAARAGCGAPGGGVPAGGVPPSGVRRGGGRPRLRASGAVEDGTRDREAED